MNDASAENLDWYWRGWFYGIQPVDLSLDSVKHLVPDFDHRARTTDSTVVMQSISTSHARRQVPHGRLQGTQPRRQEHHLRRRSRYSLHDFYYKYTRGQIPYDTTKYTAHSTFVNGKGKSDAFTSDPGRRHQRPG
jgi:hypothetical protein